MRGPDDARSLVINQHAAPAPDRSTGWHTQMALHGGTTDRELDGEKY